MSSYPSMSGSPVVLLALNEKDMELLAVANKVLTSFGVAGQSMLLGMGSGEIPDFSRFAAQANESGLRVVLSAMRDHQSARTLAAALIAPMIRIPVPLDESPAAALNALTEDAGDAANEVAAGPNRGAFATVALGEAGAKNAALLAVSILALSNDRLRAAWQAFRDEQTQAVLSQPPPSG